jgi:hypothetical protein
VAEDSVGRICVDYKRNKEVNGDNDDHEVGESMKTELGLDDLQCHAIQMG